jgi:hypothetical protein
VTQFAAAAVIFLASAFTLIPREIWTIRSDDMVAAGSGAPGPDTDGRSALDDLPDYVPGVGSGVAAGAIASAQAGADRG